MERSTAEAWASVTPADLFRAIVARLPSILLTTLVVTAALGVVLFAWPNRYSSDGLMYVRLGRGAASLDPTAMPANSVSLQESRTSEVISISEMLTSRAVAERVVDSVGVEVINQPRTWIDRTMVSLTSLVPSSEGLGGMEREDYAKQLAREDAIKRVRDSVEVSVPRDAYTVKVLARGSDPSLMREIVQSVMTEYESYHVEAHRSQGSLDFFEEQIAESEAAAIGARESLQTARMEMGWLSSESAESTLQERIVNLELSLDQADSELADSDSQMKALEERIEGLDEWIPMEITKGVANNAKDGMRNTLFGEQIRKGEELARVTPAHPRYSRLKENLNQGQDLVSGEGAERELRREAVNPVRQQLEGAYQTAVAKTAGLKSRRDSLSTSLAEAREDLKRLNQDAITLAKLRWSASIAENNYLEHARSLERARLVHELDNRKMSDISVIQNASLNLKKVGPPRLLLLMIGGLLGVCLGVLQAILRESPESIRGGRARSLVAARPEAKNGAATEPSALPEREVVAPKSSAARNDEKVVKPVPR